jgi:hypothetical protein
MLDTIFGLPTHALVVHAVVVLLPLAAVGAVAVALIPPLRQRYGLLVGVLTAVSAASVPVATHSGQHLFDRKSAVFGPNNTVEAGLMEQHRNLGHQLWPWSVTLLIGLLVVLYTGRRRDSRAGGFSRFVGLLGVAAVLVGAVLSTIMVIRIGHAGSRAVWDPLIHPNATAVAPLTPHVTGG